MLNFRSTVFLAPLLSLSLATASFASQLSTPTESILTHEKRPVLDPLQCMTLSHQNQLHLNRTNTTLSISSVSKYPVNCHWLISISDTGQTFEIEDGSHWDISHTDRYILNSWRRNDSIVISPNRDWFSSKDYYITNKSNNTYVRANLYLNPLEFGSLSHWIISIDHSAGYLTLENGMTWCIHHKDDYAFRDWEVNDHIILGINDDWFSSCNHILINTNMNSCGRASQH